MQIRKRLTQFVLTGGLLAIMALLAQAQAIGPGVAYPNTSELSDQKAGSVLIYNIYGSDAAPGGADTRFTITNVNAQQGVAVHLFFVDGSNCSVQDVYLFLTPNDTEVFTARFFDPGTTGFLVAVATNPDTGVPISFNYLIGSANVNVPVGGAVYRANLPAEAIAAQLANRQPIEFDEANFTAVLRFNGTAGNYNRLPRVLAVDYLPSPATANTLIVLNRIAGSLATGVTAVGTVFGVLYNDNEVPFSFSFNGNQCQFRGVLSDTFPNVAPPLSTVIPTGRSGWVKFYSLGVDNAYTGAVIHIDGQLANYGHNMHKLTLSTAGSFIVPIVPFG